MSIDLDVYLFDFAPAEQIHTAIGLVEGLSWNDTERVVERSLKAGADYCCHVGDPQRVELDDLPASVVAVTTSCAAVVNISVEGSNSTRARLASKAARSIADDVGGVIYDPQRDRVVWPRGASRAVAQPHSERVTVVRLTWFVRRKDCPSDLPSAFVDTVRHRFPEAVPGRFGPTEPFQYRLEQDNEADFVAAWHRESSMLFWRAPSPSFGGSMGGLGATPTWPLPQDPVGPVTVDVRVLAIEAVARSIRGLLVALASRSNAFVATAEVERNVGCGRGGSLFYDGESSPIPGSVVRGQWLGLPPGETWLAWFAESYRPLVEEYVALEAAHGGGLLEMGSPQQEETSTRRRLFARRQADAPRSLAAHLPAELLMTVEGDLRTGTQRQRATRIPSGL